MLIDILKKYSLRQGEEFTLSNGTKSTFYVDVKKTAQRGSVNRYFAKCLYEKMISKFSGVQGVAAVVLGGCHLASIISIYSPDPLDVIFVRKIAKEHGTKNLLEFPDGDSGQRIVLIEDVITTGTSALNAAKVLQEAGYKVVGILAVVDRREDQSVSSLGEFELECLVKVDELINKND